MKKLILENDGWFTVKSEQQADEYVKKGGYEKGSYTAKDGSVIWQVRKIPQKTDPPKKPSPPKPDPKEPKPTLPPTNVDPNNRMPYLIQLDNVQRLEQQGDVVDCTDDFPLALKKGDKYCRSKNIGFLNKCYFGHDLKNIAGLDLFNYLNELGIIISKGIEKDDFDHFVKVCRIQENKKNTKKIIRENTVKILSEYLNK